MVIVKVKRDTYGGERYLLNACRYLENAERSIDCDGYGVDPYQLEYTVHQMMQVKAYFGKTSDNPLMHFVVSFDQSVTDTQRACNLSRQIAAYFHSQYQVLWCVHEKHRQSSFYHCHIVINSVSYINGMMYHSSATNVQAFCDYVSALTQRPCRFVFE